MTKAAFIARPDGSLFPMDEDGRELVKAVAKNNKPVLLEYHQPRNPRHHRLLFHLLKIVCNSGAWEGDEEALLEYLKISTGRVRTIVDRQGRVFHVPRSISFESMAQDEFSRWFDRALFVVTDRLLGGHNFQSFRQEVLDAVDKGTSAMRDR